MTAIPDKDRAAAYRARQSEKVARMKAALKPFADCVEYIDADEDDEEWAKFRLLVKHYRAARQALAPTDGRGEG